MSPESIPNDQYGLPVRPLDFGPTACSVHYQRRVVNGRDFYLLIVDTADTRNVTVWERDSLERTLRAGLTLLGVLPDGLLLADRADLGDLPPPPGT